MIRVSLWALLAAAVFLAPMAPPLSSSANAQALEEAGVDRLVRTVIARDPIRRAEALAKLRERGKTDAVAALITALRYTEDDGGIADTLRALTGAGVASDDWHDWMLWQEAHPEIKPHACLLYTSPSPRDLSTSRMPSSA